jgi:hypothetical protein
MSKWHVCIDGRCAVPLRWPSRIMAFAFVVAGVGQYAVQCGVRNGAGMHVTTPILRDLGYTGEPAQFRQNMYWRFSVPQE